MTDVNRRPYHSSDTLTIELDGTVYMGNAERKSQLNLYYPRK